MQVVGAYWGREPRRMTRREKRYEAPVKYREMFRWVFGKMSLEPQNEV